VIIMERKIFIIKVIAVVLLCIILVISGYQYYSLARKLYDTEIDRGGKGYVSDEVWYVSSARNILNKIFKVEPRIDDNKYGVTIVYNKTILNITYVRRIIREYNFSVKIVDTRYYEINAIYFEANNPSELNQLISILRDTGGVIDVTWGWRLADAAGINRYLNLEHPPMVKYLIGLSMLVFGDNPFNWRIPSIIAGVLTVLFTYLASEALTKNKWLSLVISLFTGIDPITRILASIALLDIYVALFTAIVMYLVFSKRYKLALLIVIIGSLFKFNVLFAAIPVIILLVRNDLSRDQRIPTLIFSVFKYFLVSITLFLCVQITASIPLILHGGFNWWIENAIFGAIKWHTSVKCTSPGCPISSAPWDWFIGNNGFPIYYFSTDNSLTALGFWPLWSIALAYSILFLPYYRYDRKIGFPLLMFYGVFAGYVLLYIIGGRTQYSFYSVQFTPIIYVYLLTTFTYIVLNPTKLSQTIILWSNILLRIWRFILKEVLLINK